MSVIVRLRLGLGILRLFVRLMYMFSLLRVRFSCCFSIVSIMFMCWGLRLMIMCWVLG